MECIKYIFNTWYSFKGRIGINGYIKWNIFLFFAIIIFTLFFYLFFHNLVYSYQLTSFIFLIPNLSVVVRRLHDADFPGVYAILYYVPIIGLILGLVLFFLKGTEGVNRYGEPPFC